MSRLIDADALMEVLEKIPVVGFKNIDNQTYTLVLLAQVFNIIKQQPTIEERKKGKWIHNSDPMAGEGYWNCSECGLNVYTCTDYCPNCGADMRGEQDG